MTRVNSFHLEVERTKMKVTRSINAMTENQSYLWNAKAYELQTWYTDGLRCPASRACAVTSKPKALGGYSVFKSPPAGGSMWRPHTPCCLRVMLCVSETFPIRNHVFPQPICPVVLLHGLAYNRAVLRNVCHPFFCQFVHLVPAQKYRTESSQKLQIWMI